MTTQHPAGSTARRARLDLVSIVLLVLGAVGFDVCMWLLGWKLGVAVLCLYIVAGGVAIGIDREGARE